MANAAQAGGLEPFDVRAWVRAAGEGDAARVDSLLAAGADVNASLESGETALIRATSKGRLGVVRRLLEAGADPNAEREDGFTALGVAVFLGHAEIARALLAYGADPTAKGRLGASAEKWALLSGHREIAELLKNLGPIGARGPGAEADAKGKPALFPEEGNFRAVVPLAEFDGAGEGGARDAGRADESPRRGLAPAREEEPKNQEVVTIVRARAGRAGAPLAARAVVPRAQRHGWPVMLLLVGLSLIAGVAAGNYLMGSRWAESPEASPPPAAETAAGLGGETSGPQTAPPTAEAQTPPAAPPLPEPKLRAAPSGAAAVPGEEAVSKVGDKSGVKAAPTPPPRPAAAEQRRAVRAEPPARAEQPAAARAASAAGARRVASDARTPRRAPGRVTTASPGGTAPPVFSPTPSNKSDRKVIPWP